jgi:hypothetical protein
MTLDEILSSVLLGIDMTETEHPEGWWETSFGAKFGAEKLEELRAALAQQGASQAPQPTQDTVDVAQLQRAYQIVVNTCGDLGSALLEARNMIGDLDNIAFIDRALATAGISLAQATEDARDAARYRWLREVAPDRLCAIAYRVPAACEFADPDQAIDAAQSRAQQSPAEEAP